MHNFDESLNFVSSLFSFLPFLYSPFLLFFTFNRIKSIRATQFFMAGKGVTTRLQKQVGHLQQKVVQLQIDLSQWDTKFDNHLKKLWDDVLGEIKSEMQSLFEQYLGHLSPIVVASSQDRGKGILRSLPLGFPPRDTQIVSPMVDLRSVGTPLLGNHMNGPLRSYKLDCPKFYATNYQGQWSKLEQYFRAEGLMNSAKLRTVMLHLERKTLD